MFAEFFKKNKKDLKFIGLSFLIWRLSILIVSFLGTKIFDYAEKGSYLTQKFDNTFYQFFLRYDSGWYLNIAEKGYVWVQNNQSNLGFFPLFPLLIKLLSYIPYISLEISGIILSNLFTLFSLFVFYKLIDLRWKNVSKLSIILLLVFPSSFFLGYVYSESLFLLLTVSSFYFVEKKQWFASSVFGFLASLTRPIGVLLMIPILYRYFQSKNLKSLREVLKLKNLNADLLSLSLIPMGLFFYAFYLKLRFGDPLMYMKAQKYWERYFDWVWNTTLRYLKEIITNISFFVVFDLITLIFASLMILYVWRKVDKSYAIWIFFGLLIPAFSGSFVGMNRYTLVLFPIYIGIAFLLKSNFSKIIYIGLNISLLFFLCIRFTLRYWAG